MRNGTTAAKGGTRIYDNNYDVDRKELPAMHPTIPQIQTNSNFSKGLDMKPEGKEEEEKE